MNDDADEQTRTATADQDESNTGTDQAADSGPSGNGGGGPSGNGGGGPSGNGGGGPSGNGGGGPSGFDPGPYLARLVDASAGERALISVAALVLSILIGGVIVFVSGLAVACETGATFHFLGWEGQISLFGMTACYDPIFVYQEFFVGAIGGLPWEAGWTPTNLSIEVLLRRMTLLYFTGLAVAVSFRAGLFNIGTQGQLTFGALATAVVVVALGDVVPGGLVGTLVLIPAGLLAGAVVGGIYGAIPGALKAYGEANEVITTIMLNFVALYIASLLTSQFFQDPGAGVTQTRGIPTNAAFPSLPFGFTNGDFSLVALGFAVALALGIWFLLEHTSFGFDVRTSGVQPDAAEYGGVNAERTMVSSMTISGAIGGIGGAVWVLMAQGRFIASVPSLGFDGITVSVLAGNSPIGVGFSAFLFGVLKSGSDAIDFATEVPPELASVLSGLIILFVAMPEFFRMIGRRFYSRRDARDAVAADGGERDG